MCQVLFLSRLRRLFSSVATSCTAALSSYFGLWRASASSLTEHITNSLLGARDKISGSDHRFDCPRWRPLARGNTRHVFILMRILSCIGKWTGPPRFLAPTPFALPPTEPHPFPVVAPASSPGAVFPSTIQLFPLKFQAPPASAVPPPQTNAAGVQVVVVAGRPVGTAGLLQDNLQLYAFMSLPETQKGSAIFLPCFKGLHQTSSEALTEGSI